MAIASSLLQVMKKLHRACPPNILMRFSQGSIPETLLRKKITTDKVIQCLLKGTTPTDIKKCMVLTKVE